MLGLCLNRSYVASVVAFVGLIGLVSCGKPDSTLVCPPPGDICYDNAGNRFNPDGTPYDPETDGGPVDPSDPGPSDPGSPTDGGDDDDVSPDVLCNCVNAGADDTDKDCIKDVDETRTNHSDPNLKDTDGDGINDGCEDKNFNGSTDAGESDPRNTDTDGDCIPDGLEDKNKNGRFELARGETSPVLVDSDRDNINDGGPGGEDKNCDGVVAPFQDTVTANGCWDPGEPQGETNPALADTDGDGIADGREDANFNGTCDTAENSCAFTADTDCDGLPDGSEDKNRNGQFNTGETNPRNNDSDNDGLLDGIEDANKNGIFESTTETDPRKVDTDGDGINDGNEDANHNGIVDPAPRGGDGCWTGTTPGETDPRKVDSDNDGIRDDFEDKNKNGQCDSGTINDPNAPGGTRVGLTESCAFLADTDCDGLTDGVEDKNKDGSYQLAETDARFNDTDRDGLIDGCPIGFDFTRCEDITNDGRVDLGETDPRSIDTDLDGLTDRCEVQFDSSNCTSPSCITNATVEDTDGDGKTDGEEDANHNCRYEPNLGETDPRVANPAPAPGTPEYPRSQVCDAQNLKQLTFAEASDPAVDYRVAFEVEKFNGLTAEYRTRAYGIELQNANNQIVEDDPNDMVWGHMFESPAGVVVEAGGTAPINRNIYGFTYMTQDTTPLDITLDDLRDRLATIYGAAVVVEVSNVPARPAHDNLPAYRVTRAQRQYRVTVAPSASQAKSAVFVRQDLLARAFLPNAELANIRPTSILGDTTTDPVYGQVTCPSTQQCYTRFTMYISAVQRLDQIVVNNENPTPDVVGTTMYVVALTPDDSTVNSNDTVTRLYNERLTRLEDLTGGSAVARYEARRSSICEDRNATRAKADLLFVVDDSASMQAVIDKLQQASRDAQRVLTANSANVDYRVAMTTTNPSLYGRTICNGTPGSAPGAFNQNIGCMRICPQFCNETCGNDGGTCNVAACGTACQKTPAALLNAENGGNPANNFTYRLPGGGGTFYYEDTAWMDCDGTVEGVNPCTDPDFTNFFGGQPRKRLLDNAGFLGQSDVVCPTLPVDLAGKTNNPNTDCDANPNNADCCERLLDSCADGPQVLSSQMCDLIRSMGGRRESLSLTASARPNSANESGVRMARKLIDSMGLAQPSSDSSPASKFALRLDCDPAGSNDACDTDNDCGDYDFCDRTVLTNNRGLCKPTGNCQACDPRAGSRRVINNQLVADTAANEIPAASCSPGPCTCSVDTDCGRGEACGRNGTCIVDCTPVPLVTLFLSDEEDFYFKDECAFTTVPQVANNWEFTGEKAADESQMPADCYFRVTNPDGAGVEQAEPCADPLDANPFSYCQAYFGGGTDYARPAKGYYPDNVPYTELELMQWRDYNAAQCVFRAPNPANPPTDTCVADPCRLIEDPTACNAASNNGQCVWTGGTTNLCTNRCTAITVAGAPGGRTERDAQRNTCNADPACYFNTGMGVDGVDNGGTDNTVTTQRFACVPKVPVNDCQACKRLKRRYEAVHGGDTNEVGTFTNTIGFGDVGPVYAIARNRGQQGFRLEGTGQDQCAGGPITWGRGDGQSMRDIAVDTFGRAQNVCANSYQDFMQLVVTDIVALSAPYRLSQAPIAATIKVGIGRPPSSPGGQWTYIEVPRSKTRGFVYDGTSNSLGFKSDPIDGVGGPANGVLDPEEVTAARNAPEVPKANDFVFISYRFWRPVPCPEGCDPDTETCVRSICPDDTGTPSSCTTTADCPANSGRTCINNECRFACTEDGYFERCVPNPCRECETYDPVSGACNPVAGGNCACFQYDGIPCDPTGPNTCPPGMTCDEQCYCEPIPGCENAFSPDGSVLDCEAAINCCRTFSDCFAITTQTNCNGNANCTWTGASCEPASDSCCGRNETAICYSPVEDPSRKIFACQGAACSCEEGQLCNNDAECSDAPNGARHCVGPVGNKHCNCDPGTESCLPNAATGCACGRTPG